MGRVCLMQPLNFSNINLLLLHPHMKETLLTIYDLTSKTLLKKNTIKCIPIHKNMYNRCMGLITK